MAFRISDTRKCPLYSQSGFTLVELIAVIVILGVLSATALPRFANFKRGATLATLESMRGALDSAATMIYAKALLNNLTSGDQTLSDAGANIRLYGGYPTGNWGNAVRYMIGLDNQSWTQPTAGPCQDEWCALGNYSALAGVPVFASGSGAKIWPRGYTYNDSCGVYYINKRDGTAPIIGLTTADC